MESVASVERRMDARTSHDFLRDRLPEGTTIYASRVNMNREGTAETVIPLIITNGEIMNIAPYICRIMGNPYDDVNRGVRMFGGGLDLAHHMVDWLSRYFFGGEGNHLKYARV